MNLSSDDVLFVGLGAGVSGYYRSLLPARTLNCDWVGVRGDPSGLRRYGALMRPGERTFEDYKLLVLQQVYGKEWLAVIKQLKRQGVVIIYEIDDYVHGLRKVRNHQARDRWTRERVYQCEQCMKASDGVIVSTQFLYDKYRRFNANIFLCENAIDVSRYSCYERPEREQLHIGWAGGTGHGSAVIDWLPAVNLILAEFAQTEFVTIGEPYASLLDRRLHDRAHAIPFATIENYPAALTNFDIALAPAGKGNFHRAKSDLRFLEASALRIPVIADPEHYTCVRNGYNGLAAADAAGAYQQLKRLIESPDEREQFAGVAFEYVSRERDIYTMVNKWTDAFIAVGDQVEQRRSGMIPT
jgi:hypothetical protein